MRRIWTVLLAVAIVVAQLGISPIVVMANNEGDFDTVSITGGVAITSYSGSGGDVVIPSTINNQSVLEIQRFAFSEKNISSVLIPSTVKSIGNGAFQSNQLSSVEIPSSVTSIGNVAFQSNELTSVEIPNSISSIGNGTFSYNQLTSVEIPDSVRSIGDDSFRDNQLSSLQIPNSITDIGSRAFMGNQLTSVSIPNSVINIGNSAFQNNQLTNVDISNSLTSIGDAVFISNRLTTVNIPNSVTFIGSGAFQSNQLTSVEIPDSVRVIGSAAFMNNELVSVEIPHSVTNIGRQAFQHNQIMNLEISNTVTSIGDSAFDNNKLSRLEIPASVTNIGSTVFRNNQLEQVVFNSAVNNPLSILSSQTKPLSSFTGWFEDELFTSSWNRMVSGPLTIHAKYTKGMELRADKTELLVGDLTEVGLFEILWNDLELDQTSMTTFTVNNSNVATVHGNVLTAVAPGSVTVTGTFNGESSVATLTVRQASNNASLHALLLKTDEEDLELTPEFNPETTTYTSTVPREVDAITITPITEDANATVTVQGVAQTSGTASESFDLDVGENTFDVIVTAEDSETSLIYTVAVMREKSNEARLSGMLVEGNGTEVKLESTFDPDAFAYEASVLNRVNAMTITPTTEDANATVTINGITQLSGTASEPLDLEVGENRFDVTVTAEDGTTELTYAVTVTREAAPPTTTVPPSPPAPVLPPNTFLIQPSGGTIPFNFGQVGQVMFPTGAFSGQTQIVIRPTTITSPIRIASKETFGDAIEIMPTNDVNLLQPFTLMLDGNTSEDVAIYRYDEANDVWQALESSVDEGTVTALSHQFGTFAVLASPGENDIDQPDPDSGETIPPIRFGDVTGHWAEQEINQLIDLEIVQGYPDGTFGPSKSVTRAEFVTMLVSALGIDDNGSHSFTDIEDHWARDAISVAASAGIIEGFGSNTFGPNEKITREQAATMIARAMKLTPTSSELTFTDASLISTWAKDSVAVASESKLIAGYPDGRFGPQGEATRAEVAVILVRAASIQ